MNNPIKTWQERIAASGVVPASTTPAMQSEIDELRAALKAQPVQPIDMVLHCPTCRTQHIDAPDERTPDWSNPSHKSHLCHACGNIWRPADVPTNGVAATKTKGSNDAAPVAQPAPLTDAELTDIYNRANGVASGKRQPITTQAIFKAMRAMRTGGAR